MCRREKRRFETKKLRTQEFWPHLEKSLRVGPYLVSHPSEPRSFESRILRDDGEHSLLGVVFWVVVGRFVDRHASLSLRDIYCINQRLRRPRSVGDRSSVDLRAGRLRAVPPGYSRHDQDGSGESMVVNTQLGAAGKLGGRACGSAKV